MNSLVPSEVIESRIHVIRGHKLIIDKDFADVYQVETSNLNKAVERNLDRFPSDFMFQLTKEEAASLRFQIGTSNRVGRRQLPLVLTEHGATMAASVRCGQRPA
jgi:hypothetical protein